MARDGITFTDYKQAKSYADELYSQGFLPDISNPRKGVYVVKSMGERKAATRELQGLGSLAKISPTKEVQPLPITRGLVAAPSAVIARTGAIVRKTAQRVGGRGVFRRHIPTTVGKHPNIGLNMPYTIGKGRIEPMEGSIGKDWGHKGV